MAALVFAYTLSEFLIRRMRRGPYEGEGVGRVGPWADAALLFVVLLLATAGVQSFRLAAGCAAVAAVHAIAAWAERSHGTKSAANHTLEWFLATQALMGVSIWLAWRWAWPLQPHAWFAAVVDSLAGPQAMAWLNAESTPALLIGSAYLFMIDGGTRVVRGILDKFPVLYRNAIESLHDPHPGGEGADAAENAGEWIGILERIMTLTFVFTNSFTAIAFALTAKSIARFRELENKSFAEYYLLGTVGSIAVAVLAGMAVKLIGTF